MRRPLPAVLVTAGLAACGPPPCPGLPGPVPVDPGNRAEGVDWEAFDAAVIDHMEQACIPGLALALVDADGEQFSASYGWADIQTAEPLTVNTPFMVASASKMVVGLSLVLAQAEGHLDLWDPVDRHVDGRVVNPRIGTPAPPIRLAHLATHTSGVRDNWTVLDELYGPGDPAAPLGWFLEQYLQPGGRWYSGSRNFYRWAPGDAWMYSNVGAALAAHAVAGATGERFRDYTADRFFGPLGMEHTAWFLEDLEGQGIPAARPHTFTADGDWRVARHYGFPTWPDGQLRSTAGDMGRLLTLALAGGTVGGVEVLPGSAVEALDRRPLGDLSAWYLEDYMTEQRVFWFDMDLGQRHLTGHDGDDLGVSSEVFYDRDSRVGVVVLMNLADCERDCEPRAATADIQQRLFRIGAGLRGENSP